MASIRRHLQFRLATLFSLITFFCVALGFWASREHAYRERQAAVNVILHSSPPFPIGVRRAGVDGATVDVWDSAELLRDDVVVYAHVWASVFRDGGRHHITFDDEVSALLSLQTVERVDLNDLGFDNPRGALDASLRKIAKLPALDELDLSGDNSLSGEGIRNLGVSHSLRSLLLSDTRISDRDLAAITSLPNLTVVDLMQTPVSDAGVRHLAALRSLRELNLRGTKVTGTAFARLASLRKLERLNLYGTPFCDIGCRHLATLPSLRELDLSETEITDAGLVYLSKLPQLEKLTLTVDGKCVTESGVSRLKSQKPGIALR